MCWAVPMSPCPLSAAGLQGQQPHSGGGDLSPSSWEPVRDDYHSAGHSKTLISFPQIT